MVTTAALWQQPKHCPSTYQGSKVHKANLQFLGNIYAHLKFTVYAVPLVWGLLRLAPIIAKGSRSRFINKALKGAWQCTYKKTQNDRESFLNLYKNWILQSAICVTSWSTGKKHALNKQYVLLSQLHLLTCGYGTGCYTVWGLHDCNECVLVKECSEIMTVI